MKRAPPPAKKKRARPPPADAVATKKRARPLEAAPDEAVVLERADMHVDCRDCDTNFVFTMVEQDFFAEKGWPIPRQRCQPCTAAKKAKHSKAQPVVEASTPHATSVAAAPTPAPRSDAPKLTLWVNQLPFSATAADVATHFGEGVHESAVRLVLKHGKFAGTAFIDVCDFNALDAGISLHQSRFTCADGAARRINVREAESPAMLQKIKENSEAKRGIILAKAYAGATRAKPPKDVPKRSTEAHAKAQAQAPAAAGSAKGAVSGDARGAVGADDHDGPMVDMQVTCRDCHAGFVFSVQEQRFFREREWTIPRVSPALTRTRIHCAGPAHGCMRMGACGMHLLFRRAACARCAAGALPGLLPRQERCRCGGESNSSWWCTALRQTSAEARARCRHHVLRVWAGGPHEFRLSEAKGSEGSKGLLQLRASRSPSS